MSRPQPAPGGPQQRLELVQDLLDQLHRQVADADADAAALRHEAVAAAHLRLAALIQQLQQAGASAATLAGVRRRLQHHAATLGDLGRQIGESLVRLGLTAPPRYSPQATVASAAARSLHHRIA